MKLDVTRALMFPGQEFPFEAVQTIAPQQIFGDCVIFSDARLAGTLMADDDGNVTVWGEITATAHAPCANCLEPASADVRSSFRETFLRDGDPEDNEIFTYSGGKLDFEKLALSCVLLALPMRFLCREDCPGLMRYIPDTDGSNELNDSKMEHPFAAWKELLTKDEEV